MVTGDDLCVSTRAIYFACWLVNGIGRRLGVRHMIRKHIPSSMNNTTSWRSHSLEEPLYFFICHCFWYCNRAWFIIYFSSIFISSVLCICLYLPRLFIHDCYNLTAVRYHVDAQELLRIALHKHLPFFAHQTQHYSLSRSQYAAYGGRPCLSRIRPSCKLDCSLSAVEENLRQFVRRYLDCAYKLCDLEIAHVLDWVHNLEIGTQSQDSENADCAWKLWLRTCDLCNFEIGCAISGFWERAMQSWDSANFQIARNSSCIDGL